jgi:hypothetical protein
VCSAVKKVAKIGVLKAEVMARVIACALLLAMIASLVWAFAINDVGEVPAYALESEMIFRLEHAVAAVLLLAIPLVILAQLFAGRLPSSVGKEGVNWGPYAEAEQERIDQLKEGVDQLSLVMEALALSDAERRREISELEKRLKALEP